MPCDTVQLNELNMIGLNLDVLAKMLKREGWQGVNIDRKNKTVTAAGLTYNQRTGSLEVNSNYAPRAWSRYRRMDDDELQRKIKREYVYDLFYQFSQNTGATGWKMELNKEGKPVWRKKKVATGFGKSFGSESGKSGGGFTGFSWNHKK
jgi:hypothetical protein